MLTSKRLTPPLPSMNRPPETLPRSTEKTSSACPPDTEASCATLMSLIEMVQGRLGWQEV